MKTIIVYTSQTGFTKQYAQWIAEATGAECVELSAAKKLPLDTYETIVYGGWLCAGTISKLNWFKENMNHWEGKKLITFCVGGSPADSPELEPTLQKIFTAEEQQKVKLFYCPGGICYEKMSFPMRTMMKLFVKLIKGKKDKTPAEEGMLQMLSGSYDISDKKYIEPVVTEVLSGLAK